MSKRGRSDVFGGAASMAGTGLAAAAVLAICCGAPLLILALVATVASAGLIAQGAVVIGVAGLSLAAALGLRYAMRRSAARAEQPCVECGARPDGRRTHERHALRPPA